jgi:hypothetical protein
MPRVELEPPTPVFELAKTVHALDSATTVSGIPRFQYSIIKLATIACFEILTSLQVLK